MSRPFRDYDYYGDRYISIRDPTAEYGEIMWYDRDIHRQNTPTECILCIEAENGMYTKYAHPKAHLQATAEASVNAEILAIEKPDTKEYLDWYTFHYGIEYKKIYKELYKKYKEEYSKTILSRSYKQDDKICQHHLESISYANG